MDKREIYIEMLYWALPYIRNLQTHSMLRKAMDKSCYLEAQLVHNLPLKLLNSDFNESDVHFLNYQAKYYFENCNNRISPNYNIHIECIKKLFKLVPDELKEILEWSGP
ncbi:hypothetical protein [Snodgrassella sp. W8132]|uniref:hypothetical protein n=1 Tax=Snodgrassella sp. W8132 TaxID=2750994 RepID=UPI0018DE8FBC|nr:hypothetical protein [Snodgrassella sp. W8132]MBI0133452.1 zinc ABC transporter substrate-binding protein [Snodgrassella sp. W8132]